MGDGEFFVRSVSMRSGGTADAVLIDGPVAPGSYAIGACAPVCIHVSGAIDEALGSEPREGEHGFYITQGAMTIDPLLRDGRVRGRFSGAANVTVYSSGRWEPAGVITITEGVFETDLAAGGAAG